MIVFLIGFLQYMCMRAWLMFNLVIGWFTGSMITHNDDDYGCGCGGGDDDGGGKWCLTLPIHPVPNTHKDTRFNQFWLINIY